MGLEATAELYLRIIKLFQIRLKAWLDEDYPEFFIYNLPLLDVVLTSRNEKLVGKSLIIAAKKLEAMGSEFIVIPCNTVEYFIDDLRKSVNIPVISIVEEVRKNLSTMRIKKIGLLATETTLKYGTYEKELGKLEIKVVTLGSKNQRKVTKIIIDILSGRKNENDKKCLKKLIKSFDTEYVVLGCTDLPLLISQKESKIKLIDTLDILAMAAFKLSTGN